MYIHSAVPARNHGNTLSVQLCIRIYAPPTESKVTLQRSSSASQVIRQQSSSALLNVVVNVVIVNVVIVNVVVVNIVVGKCCCC